MNDDINISAELVLAANRIQHLDRSRISELLYRGIISIRDMRKSVGIPGSGTPQDAIIRLLDTASRAAERSDEEIQAALLEAADMVRTLRVIASSGIELKLLVSDPD